MKDVNEIEIDRFIIDVDSRSVPLKTTKIEYEKEPVIMDDGNEQEIGSISISCEKGKKTGIIRLRIPCKIRMDERGEWEGTMISPEIRVHFGETWGMKPW